MSKVFVSYKRDDKDKVLPIIHQLENELGIVCWMDLTGIESDEQFSNVIVNAINECEVFLFMYSKSHGNINPKKDWTVREVTFAEKKGKRIVFIDLEGYELPDWFVFRFPDQQVVKVSDSHAMNKLIRDIRYWLHMIEPILSPNDQGKMPEIHPQVIDLGLPSGTKWASCNVGASKPEEYGGYFAWGEKAEKDFYDWSTYTHCDGSMDTCRDLGSDISGTKFDVARMEWGSNWCMPTLEQFNELLANCLHERTILNGVKGHKFTSKLNGSSIFMPSAGYRWDYNLCSAGSDGSYWLSTQNPSASRSAYSLFSCEYVGSSAYFYGYPVRPVFKI